MAYFTQSLYGCFFNPLEFSQRDQRAPKGEENEYLKRLLILDSAIVSLQRCNCQAVWHYIVGSNELRKKELWKKELRKKELWKCSNLTCL